MLGSFLHAFGRGTMNGIVRQEQPDAIIYTFPSYALPPASKQAARHIPSFAIITDFDLHQRWVHPRIDRYYVATEDLKTELVSLGISGSRVAATGIPLKQSFKPRAATAELYKRYGLSPALPAVLLMAGADGVTPSVLELGERLLARSGALQVALVCGRNESLRKAAALRFAGHPEASRIRVFGYVEPIHELMSLASCIVTKPGGITLSEAIAANLPIFTYRPAPGQELRNAVYLAERGAAVIASRPGQLVSAITRLLASPERLEQSRSALRLLQTAGAADAIADDILARFSLAQEHVQAVGGRGRLLTE
jgi:processive 1,2-diacylglycerol beta-glucosyltransferase